jgi:hypothetical protein
MTVQPVTGVVCRGERKTNANNQGKAVNLPFFDVKLDKSYVSFLEKSWLTDNLVLQHYRFLIVGWAGFPARYL